MKGALEISVPAGVWGGREDCNPRSAGLACSSPPIPASVSGGGTSASGELQPWRRHRYRCRRGAGTGLRCGGHREHQASRVPLKGGVPAALVLICAVRRVFAQTWDE